MMPDRPTIADLPKETIVIDVIPFLEKLFPPDAELLLERARQLADDESLQEIARADYGYQADEMLVLLRSIRDTGGLPSPFEWQLLEVLSLTRYHDPDSLRDPNFRHPRAGLAGHQTRLFAAAVLLKLASIPATANMDDAFDSTLAKCLHSAGVIGLEITTRTGSFLTWAISTEKWDWPHALVHLALGLLICATRCSEVSDQDLGRIADWVLAVDASKISYGSPAPRANEPAPFSITQGFWEPLAVELRSRAERIPAGAAKTSIECCALLLDSGW